MWACAKKGKLSASLIKRNENYDPGHCFPFLLRDKKKIFICGGNR